MMATVHGDERLPLDLRKQTARIDKMQAELQKISAETLKLFAEVAQVKQTTRFEPWRIYAAASAVGLFAAAAAFVKLLL